MTGEVMTGEDVSSRWVVTVPATSPEVGKNIMRAASQRAGLGAFENDTQRLKVCLEPEAACLAVERTHSRGRAWHRWQPLDQVGIPSP